MKELTLAGLRTRLVQVSPPAAGTPPLVLILLHGYGAPGDDLVGLAHEFRAPAGTLFLFPEGPKSLAGEFPGSENARAWFPIDMMRLQIAAMTGAFEPVAKALGNALPDACDLLCRFMSEAEQTLGLAEVPLVLGGFSQGSIVALAVALKSTRELAGLLLMSSSLVDVEALKSTSALRALPIVQSHGTGDPILPWDRAVQLRDALTAAGAEVDWVPFPGGHGIPAEALVRGAALLKRVAAERPNS